MAALALAVWIVVGLHRESPARPASRTPGSTAPGSDPRAWIPAPTAAPHTPLAINGGPSLDATRLDALLAAYHSPLHGQGTALVALSRRYGIDDAVALAFFVMESRAGTQGEAVLTHSFGNLRPMAGAPALDGYRLYHTWLDGAAEWFRVLRTLYLDTLKLRTVDAVVPVYAPATDNNDPPAMIAGIYQLVHCWRGEPAACPADPPGVRALVTLPPPS